MSTALAFQSGCVGPQLHDGVCRDALHKAQLLSLGETPLYDDHARAARLEGRVLMKLNVDARGNVVEAAIVEHLDPALDQAALHSALTTRYSPATRCDTPVSSELTISMRFKLAP